MLIITSISSGRQNESWLLQNRTWSFFKAAREEKAGGWGKKGQDAAHPLGWGIRKNLKSTWLVSFDCLMQLRG